MLRRVLFKKTAFITLIFFVCFILSENFAFPQSEDVLATIKRHVEQGNYDEAETLLKDFIQKTPSTGKQKYKLAEAHYLLAKIYFIVKEAVPGAKEKIEQNIRQVFQLYPDFKQDEENESFRIKVEEIKIEYFKQIQNKPINHDRVIVKPTVKKKKRFPVLLVLGGAAVAVILALLLTKKKEEKPGNITSVTVEFRVTFAGENLIENQDIQVNGTTVFNETLTFTQHYNENHTWDDFQKIVRTFTINRGLGSFTIKQEVNPNWGKVYSNEGTKNGSTTYSLSIIDYTYSYGTDPGSPFLSESEFSLLVSPFAHHNPGDEWYKIKEKVITINASPGNNQKKTRKMSYQELKGESHR
jgi:hypothetical protein